MTDGVILTLAEIEQYDPNAPKGAGECRFLCPLCGDSHKRDSAHRSLAVNIETGLWHCHRCGAEGKLREFWKERDTKEDFKANSKRAVSRQKLRRLSSVLPEARSNPDPEKERKWREMASLSQPIENTPGASYLISRSIPIVVAAKSGARFCRSWFGRPAVLFPIRDIQGRLVAAQGRYLASDAVPKALTGGPVGLGVFSAGNVIENNVTVITEAPIDALSLAAAGLPAIALCGKDLREWLARKCGMKTVYLALDADEAGDESAEKWRKQIERYGASVFRLRPCGGCKDWNETLQKFGEKSLTNKLPECLNPNEGRGDSRESKELGLSDALLAVYCAEKAGVRLADLSLLVERFVLTVKLRERIENDSGESFSDPFAVSDLVLELREFLKERNLLIGSIERALNV